MRLTTPALRDCLRAFWELSGHPLVPPKVFRPEPLLARLATLTPGGERLKLAAVLARIWARHDINAAWQAVSRSHLSTAEKQAMFNELWG